MKSLLLVPLFAWIGALAGEPSKAEYAFRWEPSQGGPSSVEAVHRVLGGRTKSVQEFDVRYYELPQDRKWPQSATAVLRERAKPGEAAEYRLKFRRPSPFEPVGGCPAGLEQSYEKDVAFAGSDSVRGVYSLSCTGDDPALPKSLGAAPLPCRSRVERHNGKKYRIEVWSLPGRRTLLEVSHRAGNGPADLAEFRVFARRLQEAGAKPAASSKTELGMDCGE